jgi:hypothetical protein
MNLSERLLEEIAALIQKNPNMIVIDSYPDWNEAVFKELTSSVSAAVRQSALHILRSHLKDRADRRASKWLGARPPLDPKNWNANNLVTVYYLRCQPSA